MATKKKTAKNAKPTFRRFSFSSAKNSHWKDLLYWREVTLVLRPWGRRVRIIFQASSIKEVPDNLLPQAIVVLKVLGRSTLVTGYAWPIWMKKGGDDIATARIEGCLLIDAELARRLKL
jgi:hypothetical protein